MTAILAALFLIVSAGVADNQEQPRCGAGRARRDSRSAPGGAGDSELEQEKSARIVALVGGSFRRLAWDRVLREISLVLPEDVWLSSLSATAPVAASPTTTAGFSITGRTYSHDGVARLLARLAVVPQLSNVQLQHSTLATSETGRKWSSSRSTRP